MCEILNTCGNVAVYPLIKWNGDKADDKATINNVKNALIVVGALAAVCLAVTVLAAAIFFGAPVIAAAAAGTFVATLALPTLITGAIVTGLMAIWLGLAGNLYRQAPSA